MSSVPKNQPPTAKDSFKQFEKFVKCMLDPWMVVDQSGKIIKCNQLFAQMVGESSKKILKADSLDELLTLSISDKTLTVSDLLEAKTHNRIDEVRAKKAGAPEDEELVLIIGSFPLVDEENDIHTGTFVLLRDVTAEQALHGAYVETKTDSITDKLTGLFTRRHFESYFETRSKEPIDTTKKTTLIMVDIDFFKKVNDVYGHQAGDYVLAKTGEVMSSKFRKTDIPCRYGGEEFLVILPGTDLDGAAKAAETLRQAIQNTEFTFEGTTIPVTISCGVAIISNGESHEETMKRADECLYKAKEDGRNRVFKSTSEQTLKIVTDTSGPDYVVKT